MNYYNEFDPFAAAWLRELIKAGHISQGEVDERNIEDVTPNDLRGFKQCHFFAGIGVWSYALRLAGWPDERPVWTGSCPCQPFSAAGKRAGTADERHLWPAFYHLISECKPVVVYGEQVASKDGLAWLDTVQADLEGAGYTVGAADTCAAGFGAPHIRQRLYFVAESNGAKRATRFIQSIGDETRSECSAQSGTSGGGLAHAPDPRRAQAGQHGSGPSPLPARPVERGGTGQLAQPGQQPAGRRLLRSGQGAEADGSGAPDQPERPGYVNGVWADAEWLWCRDQKYRPVEPGTFPLAHGAANRVGRLRGYGNAIVAPQAAAFISSAMEALEEVACGNHERS